MKVLHVIQYLGDVVGGPPRALATLARAQAARGDDVIVLPCSRSPGQLTLPVGKTGTLTVLPEAVDARLLWYNARLKSLLQETARDRDIVHVHGTWRYHLLGAASVARKNGTPYIVRPAGNLGDVCFRHKSYLKLPYFELFERGVFDRAAAVHCTSRKEQDEIRPLKLNVRTFVIPQAIEDDLTRAAPDDATLQSLCPQLTEGRRIIAYVGRISFIKRIDVLLEAFIRLAAEFPDWDLVLAGPPEDPRISAALSSRVAESGMLSRVLLPGMLRGAAKTALLRRASIFAQPSMHENFGISVAEALTFGLPCVVSSGVALAADISDADAGIVCESEVPAFELALHTLLAHEDRRARCGEAARALAQQFAPSRVADALHQEYLRCIHRN